MKNGGMIIGWSGVLGFLVSVLAMPTSVDAIYPAQEVVNIGLQQQQMLAAMASLVAVIIGAVLYAAGAVIEAFAPAVSVDDDTLAQAGITRQDGGYLYKGFIYSTPAEALAVARTGA